MIIKDAGNFINFIKRQKTGTLLGLDIGTKNIGIALCHIEIMLPTPFSNIKRTTTAEDICRLAKLVETERVRGIVVGLPIQIDGTHGTQAQQIEEFATHISDQLVLPVALYDERLSTRLADRLLQDLSLSRRKRNQVDDQVAAALILDSFLKNALGNFT